MKDVLPAEAAAAAEMLPGKVPVKHLLKTLKLAAAAKRPCGATGEHSRSQGEPDDLMERTADEGWQGETGKAGGSQSDDCSRPTVEGLESYLSTLNVVESDAAAITDVPHPAAPGN